MFTFCVQETNLAIQPVLIAIIVAYLQDKTIVDANIVYACAALSVFGALIGSLADGWHSMGWYTMALQLRSMLTAAIYRKVMLKVLCYH